MSIVRKQWKTLFLCMLFAVGGALFGEFPRLDLALSPVLLPPYPESALRARLQGRLEASITFRETEPVAVRIVSSEFKSEATDPELPVPERLLAGELIQKGLEKKLLDTLQGWRSLFRKDHEAAVLVEYCVDPSLDPDERVFSVHYGGYGVPDRIVVKGPLLGSAE